MFAPDWQPFGRFRFASPVNVVLTIVDSKPISSAHLAAAATATVMSPMITLTGSIGNGGFRRIPQIAFHSFNRILVEARPHRIGSE